MRLITWRVIQTRTWAKGPVVQRIFGQGEPLAGEGDDFGKGTDNFLRKLRTFDPAPGRARHRGARGQTIVTIGHTAVPAAAHAGDGGCRSAAELPGMFPGYSVHDDIRALIDAGLSPYQALTAATRTPGDFVAKYAPASARFRTVEIGKRADIVLVDTNPLDNVATLESSLCVMTAGRWYGAADIESVLARQRSMYHAVTGAGSLRPTRRCADSRRSLGRAACAFAMKARLRTPGCANACLAGCATICKNGPQVMP
jgi:hypothetical protein